MRRPASERIEQLAQLALVLLLVVGCWLVLAPFFSAILFAIVIAVSSWPAYLWLLRLLRARRNLASLLACALVAVIVVVPVVLLALSLDDAAAWLLKLIEQGRASAPPPPQWLAKIPLFGELIQNWWRATADNQDRLRELAAGFAEPARRLALASGRALVNAVLQALLVMVLLFVLFRDGAALGERLDAAVLRIGGARGRELLQTAQHTVIGVMLSVLGAGLAQAMVAALGFSIVGVPNPFLLAALTFVLSMAPVGPPLIWGGVTLWLLKQGDPGWAVFMAVYGMFGISSIDNLIKPFLISRSSHLPFVLTLMGVIGGVIAFGVMGAFLGPTLLALAINLGRRHFGFASAAQVDAPVAGER